MRHDQDPATFFSDVICTSERTNGLKDSLGFFKRRRVRDGPDTKNDRKARSHRQKSSLGAVSRNDETSSFTLTRSANPFMKRTVD
jgi:hypothetical protein